LDIPAGIHYVKIEIKSGSRAGETLTFTFISEGTGEPYIYSKALTIDADDDEQKDDCRVYVYDQTMQPVEGAEIYVNGELEGTTNEKGYFDVIDVTAQDLETGKYIGTAKFDELVCGIGRPYEEYIPPPERPEIEVYELKIRGFDIPIKRQVAVNVTIAETTEPGAPPEGMVSIGVYIEITATRQLVADEWIFIPVYYSDEDLPENVDEETLAMYYWDEDSQEWRSCDEIGTTGIDVDENIVWANVTHLTIFAPLAKAAVEEEKPVPALPTMILVIALIIVVIIIIAVVGYLKLRKGRARGASGPPGGASGVAKPESREPGQTAEQPEPPELKDESEGYSHDEFDDLDKEEEDYHKGFYVDAGEERKSATRSRRG
jgi:hypothetical protein